MSKTESLLSKVSKLTTEGAKLDPEEVAITNILVVAKEWETTPQQIIDEWTTPQLTEAIIMLQKRQEEEEEKKKKPKVNNKMGM